jgi:long-subunit fatty acid transport protein
MNILHFIRLSLVVGAAFFSTQVVAQSIDVPSSFNPVGSGARALGLGGSFIATADDATAASWNPAALMQLRKPEVALVFSSTSLNEEAFFEVTGDVADNTSTNTDLNYFAASYPCSSDKCGKNMVFSLNYQRLYDLSREWDISINEPNSVTAQTYRQTGSLYAVGLAYAIQVNDTLNLGFTLNYWDSLLGQNGFTRTNTARETELAPSDLFSNADVTVESDFEGVNFNLGGLWVPYQKDESKVSIGFVYKSSFEADLSTSTNFVSESGQFSDPGNSNVLRLDFNSPSTITLPSSYGVGVAYKINDALTTSIDLYRTNWNEFEQVDQQGIVTSPISGSQTAPDIQDSTQIRVGVEYRMISQAAGENYIIPIRAGFFIDPIIADGSNDDGYGISVGSGIAFEHWVFDVAYQYRWADDLGSSTQQQLGLGFDIQEHQFYASSFYRF